MAVSGLQAYSHSVYWRFEALVGFLSGLFCWNWKLESGTNKIFNGKIAHIMLGLGIIRHWIKQLVWSTAFSLAL